MSPCFLLLYDNLLVPHLSLLSVINILSFYFLFGDCSWKGLYVEWSVRVKFDKRDLEEELSFCH